MIAETLDLLAEDIAARQAQIVIDPPVTDDEDADIERDAGDWTRNLGLAADVLDLAIALNDVARLTSRPRLAAWLDGLDIAQPASRRLAELRSSLLGPIIIEQPAPVVPAEIVELGFDPNRRHNDTRVVDAVVHEYVEGHSDQTVQQVAAGANMKSFTARRSLARLVDAGVIHYILGHGKGSPRLYRSGPAPVAVGDKRNGGAHANPVGTRARILALLAQGTQPLTGAEIADTLATKPNLVHIELYKLRSAGRLIATGRPYRYRLASPMSSAAD